MIRQTGEGKVDYAFEYFWSPTVAPWEKQYFLPKGTMGIIRFYNFDIDSAVVKNGHIAGFSWLGQPLLKSALEQNDDPIFVIGAHSNTGDKKYNFRLSEARAASIAQLLNNRGISSERMNVMGSTTLNRDSRGEKERWRAVSVMFTAMANPLGTGTFMTY
jgi:coenzyme F420-reducing hydrogenase delta subunit